MKYRQGFVTNSSSSSFICRVCGTIEGGYDVSLRDVYMCQCVNEHEFCIDHFVSTEKYKNFEDFQEKYVDNGGEHYEVYYDIPPENCPICSGNNVDRIDFDNNLKKMIEEKGKLQSEEGYSFDEIVDMLKQYQKKLYLENTK